MPINRDYKLRGSGLPGRADRDMLDTITDGQVPMWDAANERWVAGDHNHDDRYYTKAEIDAFAWLDQAEGDARYAQLAAENVFTNPGNGLGSAIVIQSNQPGLAFYDHMEATDEKLWGFHTNSGGVLRLTLFNDAGAAVEDIFKATRNGAELTLLELFGDNVTINGVNVRDAAILSSGTLADARIAESNVTQHQAALTITESQITDGSLLARVAANETITGNWTFDANTAFTGNVHLTGAGGYISFDSTTGNAANRISGNAHNGVADDASIQVPFGGGQDEGFVMVWTSSSGGEWFFGFLNPSGTLTAIAQGVNTSSGDTNPDVDGNLNVYKDGAGIGVKNRRGASRNIRVMLFGT